MKKSFTTIAIGSIAAVALLGACGDDKKSDGGAAAGGDDVTAFCAQVQSYKTASDALDVSMEDPTPESMKAAFDTMGSMLADLEKNAPSDIKADLGTMNDAIARTIAVFEQYDYDFMALATSPEFAEISAEMDGEDMTAVQDRLDAWTLDNCGIEMDGE